MFEQSRECSVEVSALEECNMGWGEDASWEIQSMRFEPNGVSVPKRYIRRQKNSIWPIHIRAWKNSTPKKPPLKPSSRRTRDRIGSWTKFRFNYRRSERRQQERRQKTPPTIVFFALHIQNRLVGDNGDAGRPTPRRRGVFSRDTMIGNTEQWVVKTADEYGTKGQNVGEQKTGMTRNPSRFLTVTCRWRGGDKSSWTRHSLDASHIPHHQKTGP